MLNKKHSAAHGFARRDDVSREVFDALTAENATLRAQVAAVEALLAKATVLAPRPPDQHAGGAL